jgi:hypothetical protein
MTKKNIDMHDWQIGTQTWRMRIRAGILNFVSRKSLSGKMNTIYRILCWPEDFAIEMGFI